ncbi:putative potassium transporter [Dioscorea sansibarensis]
MDVENLSTPQESRYLKACGITLLLAYQSLGVVYGDLSISPIYVYRSTFSGKLHLHEKDAVVLGVFSLVFWTLTLIPLCKYVLFVLQADDNGEGGTFALYSLMCRKLKIGHLRYSQPANNDMSLYNSETSQRETRTGFLIKKFFDKHQNSRVVLLLVVLLGTSMIIGDGVLTPTMSVLSAVSGIQIKAPNLHENYIVLIACMILVGLFSLQHYGTHRVGFLFAPILIAWLCCVSGVGIYNIFKWNPSVCRATSPYYIYNFFKETGKDGWSSLGGIILCITGSEAMFADLGHFSKLSIRMAFTAVVYPCLVVAYMGEAAYLTKHIEDLERSFYKSIPEHIFWPVFIIATLATVVGSQAIISATFSIISQCQALGCFPRVKITHTSSHIHGQIYIPEINWLLMFLCIILTITFKDTHLIGNAYGLAVITVMFITTCLMFLIITTVWKRTIVLAVLFILVFGSVELVYFLACLAKVHHGGWLPLVFSLFTLLLMCVWHYGTAKKQAFEFQNKVCLDWLLGLGPSLGMVRLPGIGLVFTSTTNGLPPMFAHFITNFPAFHRICIFVSLHTLTIPKVPLDEQFLIGRVGPAEYSLFRCIVRYGYKDARKDSDEFENQVLMKVAEFLQQEVINGESPTEYEYKMPVVGKPSEPVIDAFSKAKAKHKYKVRFTEVGVMDEVSELIEQKESGVSYMMGNTCVVAHDSSSFLKRFVIDIIYGFLHRNSRRRAVALGIPHTSLIEVGIVYRV